MISSEAQRRLIRRGAVLNRVGGMSVAQLYSLMREGKFPRPVKLCGHSVAWPEHEVNAWIAARIAERDGAAVAA
jgi:prophage regulatory protein